MIMTPKPKYKWVKQPFNKSIIIIVIAAAKWTGEELNSVAIDVENGWLALVDLRWKSAIGSHSDFQLPDSDWLHRSAAIDR